MQTINNQLEKKFSNLFEEWSGETCRTISPLPESGSYRLYVRVAGDSKKAVAVYHTDIRENGAFIGFARHFRKAGLPVPEIYKVSNDLLIYLQEDFGDTDLFSVLHQTEEPDLDPEGRREILKRVIDWLPRFQVEGHKSLDYSLAYPRKFFDRQSMLWDLNYFKYNFLKLVKIGFDEQALEDDFQVFTDFLSQAPTDAFLYRDFQTRNIMIMDGQPRFIDFQGGRMGFPAYDLASLLYDAKAGFSPEERDWMYGQYREGLNSFNSAWPDLLDHYFPGFVLIRKMQALGAFGFRGLIEKKKSFLLSIPPAMGNLERVTRSYSVSVQIPELWRILCELPGCPGMLSIYKDIDQNHSD